jgi:deoxyguanosine kinase
MTAPIAARARGPRPHRYIAVEGVIGVGKTTLVERLARRLSARMVFEEFEENPFLAQFYQDREAYAFSTQLFFLMSRYRQQELLAQGELFRTFMLADYLFDKDRIFANLTLGRHELALYERLFSVLEARVPRPDLVIYLHADLDVTLARIRERGRSYEQSIDPQYLRSLDEAYRAHFRAYVSAPVVSIDTTHLDFRAEGPALEALVHAIMRGDAEIPELADQARLALPFPEPTS